MEAFDGGAAAGRDDIHLLHRDALDSFDDVKQRAYNFDGRGHYSTRGWDLSAATSTAGDGFYWFHVELPRGNSVSHHQRLALSAQSLIDALCPPLKLQDILALSSNGPFCGHVDGALVFRVNSPGPASSAFTLRLAARVTESSLITVSLGRVPRLGFSPASARSLLSEIPKVERDPGGDEGSGSGVPIPAHVLEFLLTMNHSEGDNPVPRSMSNLLVHVVDMHIDHLQDIVARLEMELDAVELELDAGGSLLKKQMLDDRRFPKMHLDLQRLLQAVSQGEQVFPRVKEKCATKPWFSSEDVIALEELIGRLRRLKENLGFIVNRVTAVQAGLDSWQAEQINKRLYYLSFLSIIFLPLSVLTGIFGMNVGGVPWTTQKDPQIEDGFVNVMILCIVLLVFLLLCFMFPTLYARMLIWRRKHSLKRKWSFKGKSYSQGHSSNGFHKISTNGVGKSNSLPV